MRRSLLVSFFALVLCCDAIGAPRTLSIATWNLEWLVSARSIAALRQQCLAPQRSRSLPCDVPAKHARNSADFSRLASYARKLDADVIALQEVEDERTAREVFPGYQFCFTARRDLQNVGFAIRKGVPFRCGADLVDLSLRDSVRRGASLVLLPGSPQEIHMLAVHLKSGCSRKPIDSYESACGTLRRQVPALEAWIDSQAEAGRRFAVLGDFNRDLRNERDAPGLWRDLDDHEPAGLRLRNAGEGQPFSNCVIGQTFTGFIDYIILGGPLADALLPGSFRHPGYEAADFRRYRLSDHCPVAVRLRLN
ncbi:MAG: endonuclease/exonuclease/phosphatase family protein [Steroidobacteraceae bacterium]